MRALIIPLFYFKASTKTTLYHETTCIDEIMSKLKPILKEETFSLQSLLEKGHLKPFAHLETKRKSYGKDQVNIVIDATDWGHIVGEIEIMVHDKNQVLEATKKIEDLSKELGKFVVKLCFL